jgi:hypothetical protein
MLGCSQELEIAVKVVAPVPARREITMCPASSEGALSPVEDRVRHFLIERAKKADPSHPLSASTLITYGDLCAAIDPEEHYWRGPRYRGIGQILGRVSSHEDAQGRPMLSALVVLKGIGHAGDGFAGLGRSLGKHIQPSQERTFWRSQVEAVIEYWSGPGKDEPASDPVAKARALLATVSGEIEEIRRLLGAL